MKYTLPLPPTGTNHAYHTNQGRWYKDSKVTGWEADCLYRLKGKVKKITKENITVNICFYDGDKRRRDIDGRIKSVLDLFTKAGAYEDDLMVMSLIVTKRYDKESPRMEVDIY